MRQEITIKYTESSLYKPTEHDKPRANRGPPRAGKASHRPRSGTPETQTAPKEPKRTDREPRRNLSGPRKIPRNHQNNTQPAPTRRPEEPQNHNRN